MRCYRILGLRLIGAGADRLAVAFAFFSKNESILSTEPSHDAVTFKNQGDRVRVIGHPCPEMDRGPTVHP